MLLIGLTGSIATGKSTVSAMLAAAPFNLPIIDADVLARKVVEPGQPAYKKVVTHFLPTTPDLLETASASMPADGPHGRGRPLNRIALGRRVFGDTEERRRDRATLNSIVHPAVRWEMYRAALRCYLRGHWACVLDIPLLFESQLDRLCGVVMVVGVKDSEVQLRRLMARNPELSRQDAENRVHSQGNVLEKTQRCLARGPGRGFVVWNDGTLPELQTQVGAVMRKIHNQNPTWWQLLLLFNPLLALGMAAYRFLENSRINEQWRKKSEKAKL